MVLNSMVFFPYSVADAFWLAPLALALDLRFGDPPLPWPHPVVFLGRLLNRCEVPCRKLLKRLPCPQLFGRLAGLAALFLLVSLSATVVLLLISLPILGPLFALYFAWAGLAMGSLLSTGDIVRERVENAPLVQARRSLSWLVSRETRQMDRQLMRKTLADTMSENFTDALTAPFFWLLVTGPVGLWIYKAVSTTDSMWGYLTPQWRYLGWAGARGDDILAFLPARLSIAAIGLSDFCLAHCAPAKRSWKGRWPGFWQIHKEAWGMPSPNSGCPMAALAWLCKARMAGPSVYFGTLVPKPWLGPPKEEAENWDQQRLGELFHCMRLAAILGMSAMWLLAMLIVFCIV
ncbi:MAG: cobalamin biosynthesis protein [Desulfovibrio sp.]|nr:cobalamin biosynthesis protein [Desulfovibrio sp.]